MASSSTAGSGKLSRFYRSSWVRWPLFALLGLLVIEAILRTGDPSGGDDARMPASPHLIWVPQDGDPREASFTLDQAAGSAGRSAVFVGDSSVYGHGLNSNQSFPTLVAAAAPGRIRTLNLAAPGYSSSQSIRVLEAVVPREKPELIVVANLWSDNNLDSFVDEELLARRDTITFRILFYTNQALSQFATWRLLLNALGQLGSRTVGWGKHIEPDARDRRRVAINDYAANLERISELARKNNAEVLFLMLANEEDLREKGAIWPWHLYRRVMEESAIRLGHPILRLPDELVATGLSKEALFMDEMHPSIEGHQVIARIIARRLEEWGWLSGGALPGEASGASRPTYVDPLVTVSTRYLEGYSEYSVTGILKTPEDRRKAGATVADHRRILLEAVASSDSATVLDSVTLPYAAAFVLTIDPPQEVALRLRHGYKDGDRLVWNDPFWLVNGQLDLTNGPAWSLMIDVPRGVVVHPTPLPDGWSQFR